MSEILNSPEIADAGVVPGLETDVPGDAFVVDATAAFAAVQRALADLVDALPARPDRATDVQRALSVDYKLAWQVFNIARTTHPLSAAGHVPGPPSLKRLLAAAESVGVPFRLVRRVREAVGGFEEMIRAHAGNRASFDSMIAAVCACDSTDAIDLLHRRNTYRGNVHIWGLQVETFYAAVFIRRSASGKGTDECAINFKLGLRRHRPDVSAVVHGYRHHSSTPEPIATRIPLRPDAMDQYGAPLLSEFSTNPLPRLRTTRYDDGWTNSELIGDAIGLRSAVDLCFASAGRDVPFSYDVDGRHLFRSAVTFATPAALLVSDLLVHRSSFGAVQPELVVHRSVPGDESPAIAGRAQRLPTRDKIVALDVKGEKSASPDVPRVPEMLRFACGELGWNLDEFDLFRVRMQYPVLNSVVRQQFHLPSPLTPLVAS